MWVISSALTSTHAPRAIKHWAHRVHKLIEGAAFGPEVVALISRAYDAARRELGAAQPATVLETVARRIIDAARTGEHNPEKLTAIALRGLDGHLAPR